MLGGTLWYPINTTHHSTVGQADGGMLGALLVEDQPLVFTIVPMVFPFFLCQDSES